jgi:molecular chaperone HscB
MDPFETLGIPRSFDVDLAAVERTHRDLSRALHPDRFVSAAPSERRAALSKAAEVNEAFRIVRDPIRRAEALFRLAGVPVGEDKEPKADPDFLMEVLEQREALAEAKAKKDLVSVMALAQVMQRRAEEAEHVLARGFSGDGTNVAPLLPKLGELRFYRRFLEEVSAIEDDLSGA